MHRYPSIPRLFLTQNSTRLLSMLIHRVGLFIACLFVLTIVIASDGSLLHKLLFSLPLIALGSISLHNVGLLGHEGTHFTLSNNRYQSALLGTFFSSMVPFHFNAGFALTHALHHWHTNTEKDPDVPLFSVFKNFLTRLVLARSRASRAYFLDTLRLAMGRLPRANQVGLPTTELFKLARWNLFWSALFLALYAYLIFLMPDTFGIAMALIYVVGVLVSGLRPYMEHAGTDVGPFSQARTFSNRTLDYVFGTINYHQAHHMYPSVPAYNLSALNRWLVEQGRLPQHEIISESSSFDLLKQVALKPYGRR